MAEGTMLDAGRELDALIAERVMGWQRMGGALWMFWTGERARYLADVAELREQKGIYHHPGLFCPSTDIAAAWEVVEALRARSQFSLYERGDTRFVASFGHADAAADTAPLAICRAALATLPPAGAR